MATADEKKANDERNFVAAQTNWEQRIRNELDSATKWNENWGVLYTRDIPNDYSGKIKYLEEELKNSKRPTNYRHTVLRDGMGYKEPAQRNYRRQKFEFNGDT